MNRSPSTVGKLEAEKKAYSQFLNTQGDYLPTLESSVLTNGTAAPLPKKNAKQETRRRPENSDHGNIWKIIGYVSSVLGILGFIWGFFSWFMTEHGDLVRNTEKISTLEKGQVEIKTDVKQIKENLNLLDKESAIFRAETRIVPPKDNLIIK